MTARYRHPDAIVSTDWLAAHLGDTDLRVYECTTYLDYLPEGSDAPYVVVSGRADFDQGHVRGAGFLDIQNELSDRRSPAHLRFTLPAPDALAAAFGRAGIGDGTRVVLYSRGAAQWATRVWWMLRAIGFDHAAVLDGGWEKWQREGRAVCSDPPAYPPATLTPRPRPELFVDSRAVRAAMDDPDTCLINALSPELHRGEIARYGRRGHIPGSANVPAQSLTDPDTKTFVDADTAARAFAAAGADPDRAAICYCGGGIAATLDAFLLYQLGHGDIAVYDASMSEWARDPALPIESDVDDR
ncbi:MAG: rhodanese-like domain-containing protein [Gammaproteobacteria bacterium]|nr:rhodanese-like domain-containing protein [Gammaproteobacteria bacterium]